MHLHASAMDFMVFVAYSIIFGFLWRLAAARWSEGPLGKAMAYIN